MFIVYRRVSTEDQVDSRHGLNAQNDACIGYASKQGGIIKASFCDEGISGAASIEKRPGLMNAINVLEKGDTLLVAKRDRLGRDPLVVAMIEASVARKGGKIISVAGEGTESNDPTNILMRRMVDAFAEYERLIIKARTKAALEAKKNRSERVGSIPYGFELENDGLHLIPNQAEQKIIEDAKSLRAINLSLREVSLELSERGFLARNGKPFQAVQIQRMVNC